MSRDKAQFIIVTITQMITASLSICGSIAIIVMLLRSNKKLGSTYRRLLFGMSIMDVIFSTGVFMGPFPSPKDTPDSWSPIGNDLTCTLQGLAIYVGHVGLALYNLCLCLYFTLSIVKNVRKTQMEKFEVWFHVLPMFWIVSTSVVLLSSQNFNTDPFQTSCLISSAPKGCQFDENVECTRGINAKLYNLFFVVWSIILSLVGVCSSMAYLIWSVRKQDQRMDVHRRSSLLGTSTTLPSTILEMRRRRNSSGGGDGIEGAMSPSSTTSNFSRSSQGRVRESVGSRFRREASKQALCHVLAFFGSFLFLALFHLVSRSSGEISFILWELQALTAPTQGFFNFMVFLRPRVSSIRVAQPNLTLLEAIRLVIRQNGEEEENNHDANVILAASQGERRQSERRQSRRYTAREWHLKALAEAEAAAAAASGRKKEEVKIEVKEGELRNVIEGSSQANDNLALHA